MVQRDGTVMEAEPRQLAISFGAVILTGQAAPWSAIDDNVMCNLGIVKVSMD
jgi:hypothetical protein